MRRLKVEIIEEGVQVEISTGDDSLKLVNNNAMADKISQRDGWEISSRRCR